MGTEVDSFRPMNDRILVRVDPVEDEVVGGGIVVPRAVVEKLDETREHRTGTVLQVGAGRRLEGGKLRPVGVAPGTKVVFLRWKATEVVLDGEDLLVVREDEVLAEWSAG